MDPKESSYSENSGSNRGDELEEENDNATKVARAGLSRLKSFKSGLGAQIKDEEAKHYVITELFGLLVGLMFAVLNMFVLGENKEMASALRACNLYTFAAVVIFSLASSSETLSLSTWKRWCSPEAR
jgi:hypothetical protein